MKVLIVHNFYQISGGEDKVVEEEIKLLKKNNIKVITYFISNNEINSEGITNKLKLGLNTIWSKDQYSKMKKIIKKEKPDIVHFHNTFPLLSPSVYYACKDLDVPVVQTLHNYRLLCPNGMFLKENNICQKCLTGSILNSIRNGCYRDSKIQTAPITSMISIHRLFDTWNRKVDKYIALTEFSKEQFVKGGISSTKIVVKPNFVSSKKDNIKKKQNYYLFVGRISEEKGLETLLSAWENAERNTINQLLIIGDGPLKNELESKYQYHDNINFLGKLGQDEVLQYMAEAKYVVIPSIWYEPFGLVAIEALSVATPIIASKIGALENTVQDNINGFHFEAGNVNDLTEKLNISFNYEGYVDMQKTAIEKYEKEFSPEQNFEMLMEIYQEVIKEN